MTNNRKLEGRVATKNTQEALDGYVARTTKHSFHHGESMHKHKAVPRAEDAGLRGIGWSEERGK